MLAGSSKVTSTDHDEPAVEITTSEIRCGIGCQFALLHGDIPDDATDT
jgi:hypothetical protein